MVGSLVVLISWGFNWYHDEKKIWPTLAPGTAGEIQATCFALVDLVVVFFGGEGMGRVGNWCLVCRFFTDVGIEYYRILSRAVGDQSMFGRPDVGIEFFEIRNCSRLFQWCQPADDIPAVVLPGEHIPHAFCPEGQMIHWKDLKSGFSSPRWNFALKNGLSFFEQCLFVGWIIYLICLVLQLEPPMLVRDEPLNAMYIYIYTYISSNESNVW